MGKEQISGIRAEMGGQPEFKPRNQLEKPFLLRFPGMVVAVVGAIVAANAVASRVKRFMEREIQAASLTDD